MTGSDRTSSIILCGLAGTGATTVSKLLASQLQYQRIYAGGIFRQLAAEAGQNLEDFLADLTKHPEREKEIDRNLMKEARKGRMVIDGRVIAWLVPDDRSSFKIWLICDLEERIRRINRREKSADSRARVTYREEIDALRYKELYGIDISDFSVFDTIVDTTNIPPSEVANVIIDRYRSQAA